MATRAGLGRQLEKDSAGLGWAGAAGAPLCGAEEGSLAPVIGGYFVLGEQGTPPSQPGPCPLPFLVPCPTAPSRQQQCQGEVLGPARP